MKKHVILFWLWVIVCSKINAQTYTPFPTDSAQWSVMRTIYNFSQNSFQYKMKGDTVLNGITYHKIYYSLALDYSSPNQSLHCFLREDTTKKVFVKYPTGSGIDTSEFMLYNFNLAVGDTVTIRLLNYTTDSLFKLAVTNVFLTMTSTGYRKKIVLQPIIDIWGGTGGCYQMGWIEGIGSIFGGLLYDELPEQSCSNGIQYDLTCFWDHGVYILGGNECDYSTGINEKQGSDYQTYIYPNPAQNSINFEANFETDGATGLTTSLTNSFLIITDVVGRQKGKYNIPAKNSALVVNTETYSNGIYFYSVYNNGILKETEKFIISK
ncbi:MAG: T9SS type A sorting domain-containing protein [Bacteroidia bacterium]|nr:T9SS type A sorting domain-containing protein [Bacteroidia bacterium]